LTSALARPKSFGTTPAMNPGPFLLSYSVIYFIFLIFSFLGRAQDWAGHLVSFLAHVNLPYRSVS